MPEPTLTTLAVNIAEVKTRLAGLEAELRRSRQPWPTVLSSLAATAALVITIINL